MTTENCQDVTSLSNEDRYQSISQIQLRQDFSVSTRLPFKLNNDHLHLLAQWIHNSILILQDVTQDFCKWVSDLGGESNNIEESTIYSLFASGYVVLTIAGIFFLPHVHSSLQNRSRLGSSCYAVVGAEAPDVKV